MKILFVCLAVIVHLDLSICLHVFFLFNDLQRTTK